jgi:hypothetical protein
MTPPPGGARAVDGGGAGNLIAVGHHHVALALEPGGGILAVGPMHEQSHSSPVVSWHARVHRDNQDMSRHTSM